MNTTTTGCGFVVWDNSKKLKDQEVIGAVLRKLWNQGAERPKILRGLRRVDDEIFE